jgi:hypothetical protein
MADSTAEARQQVADARRATAAELDTLGTSARAALDFPAKIRKHPLQTAGVLGGAAFMVMGGPKRVARAAEERFFPKRGLRPPKLMPKDLEKTLDRLPEEDRELIGAHLERDFAAYLKKEHVRDAATGRQSFWKAFDLLVAVLGAAATRELVRRALSVPAETGVEHAKEDAKAAALIEQSGARTTAPGTSDPKK